MSATLADLDTALKAQAAQFATFQTALNQLVADVNTLVAKAQAGQDFTNEVTQVNATTSALQTAISQVQTADAAATSEPPATPAA